jgi:phage repressor protein C with HTH and peptisase S24 domain
MDAVRKRILRAISERGMDMKSLSLAMGRNAAYMQQFFDRNIPLELKERDRKRVADLLGIPENEIGGPITADTVPAHYRSVPEYGVHASAGGGAVVSNENVVSNWPFPEDYLASELRLGQTRLAIIEVRGDSMEPTLSSGDRILVNLSDQQISQPGIFVLFDGDGTVIKRVEKVPGKAVAVLISDNSLHTRYEVPLSDISVAGRVVWRAGRV